MSYRFTWTVSCGLAFLIAFLCWGTGGAAQTLEGSVRTGNTPLVGATVRLLELGRVQRTGAHGQFRFADVGDGTYRVFVSLSGYASATDTIRVHGTTTTVSFTLRSTAIPLAEIVVSASPTARPSDEQYQSAASKSQVDFDNSPGSSFAEKIADLPGVTACSLPQTSATSSSTWG